MTRNKKVFVVAKATVTGGVTVKLVTDDVDYACDVAEELGEDYSVTETYLETEE